MSNPELPDRSPETLAVKLTPEGERILRSGHPWLFSKSIVKLNKRGVAGDIAVIFDKKNNKVIALGLYDPDSPIRIKVLEHEGGAKLDLEYFRHKILKAFKHRMELLKSETTGYRLIFGENDGFPGLIVDMYDQVVVLKIYSPIWFPYLKLLLSALREVVQPKDGVLRLSRRVGKLQLRGLQDGMTLFGELEDEEVIFMEHGLQFIANVVRGHKTGYFLDHRHNRKRVGELAKGKALLDVFSYAGGFSVHALANGATAVTSLDVSEQALELSKRNVELNNCNGKHYTICGNAFTELEELVKEKKTYDVVVIDPPSFAKRKEEVPIALKKYGQLAKLGAQLTENGGTLVMASCSSRVNENAFFRTIEDNIREVNAGFRLDWKSGHAIDHPVTFPEGAYLKCGYYTITKA